MTGSPEIHEPGDQELARAYPRPQAQDHKYTRGVLGLITGSNDYPGAALMSSRAAVYTGAGMVRFVGDEALNFRVQLHQPEMVCSTVPPEQLHVQAWAAGSGATGEEREPALTHAVQAREAAVLDAAAVDIAARWVGLNGKLGVHKILTPHAGELEQLFRWLAVMLEEEWKKTVQRSAPGRADIEADPVFWVRQAARLTGATVLLKGASTHIASGDAPVLKVVGQTPWLATAGSGDTLTGILGSLLAQAIARQNSPEKPEELGAEFYSQLAATAVRLHNLAALAVHGGEAAGPTPPSLVAEKIPAALAQLLRSL